MCLKQLREAQQHETIVEGQRLLNSTYHGMYVFQIAFSHEKMSKTVTRFFQSFALLDKVVQLQLS